MTKTISLNAHGRFHTLLKCVVLSVIVVVAEIDSAETPDQKVKTQFVVDANLSSSELKQVVNLALQCGISDVESVETFYYLPIKTRGIKAHSKKQESARTITYQTVLVGRETWDSPKWEGKIKTLGEFWVIEPYIQTTVLREFTINNKKVYIKIDEGMAVELADKVIPRLLEGKVRFYNEHCRKGYQGLQFIEAKSVGKSWSDDQAYEVRFGEMGTTVLEFKEEKGEIVVTGVTRRYI